MDEKVRVNEAVLIEEKHARLSDDSPMRFEVSDKPILSEETVSSVTYSKLWTDKQINAGGRVLDAIVRPYPIATPGTPLKLHFNMEQQYMYFMYEHGAGVKVCQPMEECKLNEPPIEELGEWCEFFLPRLHFPSDEDVQVCVSNGVDGDMSCDGEWIVNTSLQRLWYGSQ